MAEEGNELDPSTGPSIEGRPTERRQQVDVEQAFVRAEHLSIEASAYVGPFPPPDTLARYNEILPGAAERIFQMAEEQSRHRQNLERIVVDRDSSRANWGLACGFVVAMTGLLVSGLLALHGRELTGTTIGALDLLGLVGVFIYGTKSRRSERAERRNDLERIFPAREGGNPRPQHGQEP